MKQFVFYFGWQGKDPYSPMLGLKSSHEEISEPTFLELKKGKPINIKISKNSQYYCRGYINKDGKRVLCPDNTQLPLKQNQCHECENRDFYNCRIFCRGDFCHPSSPEAKQYCWNKTAYVYLTAIAGKIKVGSSTNPRKRWIGQGSDIGIVIAQDVGLNPRALEQSIATRLKLPLAIRTSEKIKFLGNSSKIIKMTEKIQTILKKTYHAINSPILIPQQELSDLVFLAPYYGDIPKLTSRPLLRKITPKGCEINGKIVGVKGTVLVVKEGETYFACNLKSLIGTYIIIEEELSAKRGQRSLFEFV